MNEKYNDTLVQRVMKKVAELRLWQFKNDKSGFEAVYRDVLREVEELPESRDKSHALADVLLCGWWWLPGEKNDTLLKRIADAAIEGKNEEAMTFIVIKEDSRFWGSAKIDFMRSEQIPRLEQAGFRQTLGSAIMPSARDGRRRESRPTARCAKSSLKRTPITIWYPMHEGWKRRFLRPIRTNTRIRTASVQPRMNSAMRTGR